MKKAVRGMVVLAGLAVFGTAQAADWVQFATMSKGGGAVIYADNASIKKQTGGTLTAWIKTEFRKPQVLGGQTYVSTTHLERVDCSSRQISTGTMIWYGQDGAVVHQEPGFGPMGEPAPETIGESILNLFCPT
ncbi:hypothetical protein AWB79_07535 [Caballeronia hypogeia]|uniref:Surface-adhesin protein E-like domain-containing protein n=1 Tax=Caballeronia hypogeia TaxID=1777140 RepID=A0A158DTF9_9BURK|nr:surface-adhesin E family protein [Caballeronia hypogeia]SAK97902.1 hypothetical protein AWB79_07535 [Caballeronia hypogeia]